MTESEFDLDYRPRFLVPWLTGGQVQFHSETRRVLESGDGVICCLPPRSAHPPAPRRCPVGPYFLATFAAEPSATPCPARGFLLARPIKGRRFEIEDSRNTRKGGESFGTTVVLYAPDRLCVELKSLKLYLWSFRDEGHYFEEVTNRILDDLVRALRPRRLTVVGRFNVRGGIGSTVVARHEARRPRRRNPGAARP